MQDKDQTVDLSVTAGSNATRIADLKIDIKSLAAKVAASPMTQRKVENDQDLLAIVDEASRLLAETSNVPRNILTSLLTQLLILEVGFPTNYDVYTSDMWDSSKSYRGVMQTSKGNWVDTRSRMAFLHPRVDDAPLLHQMIGVFGYLLRAQRAAKQLVKVDGKEMSISSADLPLSAGAVYAVHNQGYNGAVAYLLRVRPLIGNQSVAAKKVLAETQDAVKGSLLRAVKGSV